MSIGNLSVFYHVMKLVPGKASADDVLFLMLRLRIELSKSGGDEDVQGLVEKTVSDVDAGQEFKFGGNQAGLFAQFAAGKLLDGVVAAQLPGTLGKFPEAGATAYLNC